MAALTSPEISKVSNATIQKAVKALLKWKSSQSETLKPQLLDSDEFLYLVITLHKIPPKSRTNAFKIPLPNPLYSDQSELCLIIDDKNLESKSAKQKVLDEKIPVAKVLKLSKLRSDYKAYEAKRKLCDSYDLFLADRRITPLLPRAIGKHFYKKKKLPIPIELGRKNWKEQIERVCGSALLFVSTGSCCVVKIARGSMSESEIVENVMKGIDGVVGFLGKGWRDVRSLHLKFSGSVALPLYQSVPEIKLKFGGGFGGLKVVDEELSEVEYEKVEGSEKKKGKNDEVGKKKKRGRIHEVRYMDDVGIGGDELSSDDDDGEVLGNEEENDVDLGSKKMKSVSGEKKEKKGEKGLKKKKEKGEKKSKKRSSESDGIDDDDDGEDLGDGEKESDESGSGEKVSKKRKNVSGEKEVKKGEKSLKKNKKEEGEKKSKKRSSKSDSIDDDVEGEGGDVGIAEDVVEKGKKGAKNVSKGKKLEKGLKQMKEEVLGKSGVVKKMKKSKVAV